MCDKSSAIDCARSVSDAKKTVSYTQVVMVNDRVFELGDVLQLNQKEYLLFAISLVEYKSGGRKLNIVCQDLGAPEPSLLVFDGSEWLLTTTSRQATQLELEAATKIDDSSTRRKAPRSLFTTARESKRLQVRKLEPAPLSGSPPSRKKPRAQHTKPDAEVTPGHKKQTRTQSDPVLISQRDLNDAITNCKGCM